MSVLPKQIRMFFYRKMMMGLLLAVASLFLAGCSPEAVLGGAIVASILIAEQESPPPIPVRPSRVQPQPRPSPPVRSPATPVAVPAVTKPAVDVSAPSTIEITKPAQVTTEECRNTINQGMEAYENLQWNQASGYFQQVTGRDCLCPEDRARVYLFWGAIEYQSGSVNQAQTYFRQAKKLQPGMMVSKDYFPPPMVEFFQGISTP